MSDAPSYSPPVPIDGVMCGATISRVVRSQHNDFHEGDWVLGYSGWQDYEISAVKGSSNWAKILNIHRGRSVYSACQVLLPIWGCWISGSRKRGDAGRGCGYRAGRGDGRPDRQTQRCRVVGVAGGSEKCRHAVDTLGFDACLDHHASDFAEQLAKACPQGIDIYFENVGGKVFDAVLPLLNTAARIPLCGLISGYNATSLPDGPDRVPLLMGTLLKKEFACRGLLLARIMVTASTNFSVTCRSGLKRENPLSRANH
jgi:NADPH-dependent curcumin reductase CurA